MAEDELMQKMLYENIEIVDIGRPAFRKGALKIQLPYLIWRRYGSDKTIVMNIPEIDSVTWIKMAPESIKFDFHMKQDGVKHQFAGFTPDDQVLLVDLLNGEGVSTREQLRVITGQISASLVEIKDNSLALKVDPLSTVFEVSLADVTEIETIGDEDVKLTLHVDNTFGATQADWMTETAFSIPKAFPQFSGVEGSTTAEEFKKALMSLDCIRLGGNDPVATFQRLVCLSPRGVYDLDFHLQFFGLKGGDRASAVTLLYRSIVSVHILPKPNESPKVFLVICVDPPLQMGRESHPYLVIMLNSVDEPEKPVEILMNDELYAAKFGDKLKKIYEGDVLEIMVSLFEGFSGKKRNQVGQFGHGVNSIRKAGDQIKKGWLYPLEDAFYFIGDPSLRIFYNEITYAEIEGPEDGYFNLEVIVDTERFCFNRIVESELDDLVAFVSAKDVTVNFGEDPLQNSKGFKAYKKAMEKQFPGESSDAVNQKVKKLWIEEVSAEVKEFYEMTG